MKAEELTSSDELRMMVDRLLERLEYAQVEMLRARQAERRVKRRLRRLEKRLLRAANKRSNRAVAAATVRLATSLVEGA